MDSTRCAIFFHNYYGNHEEWVRHFCRLVNTPFTLFYNIVTDSLYNLEEDPALEQRLENAARGSSLVRIVLRRSSNQGKDIGGKLVLLDAFLRLSSRSSGAIPDLFLFLHDKKSPYKAQGAEWKEKLFRIVGPEFVEKAVAAFAKDPQLGLIADRDTIRHEFDPDRQSFISENRDLLTRACADYGISTRDFHYVAGTMFWARAQPMLDFFRIYPPLDIRSTLEKGNITDENAGTNTHTWERLLSWLIFAQGFTIKGLS